MYKHITFPIETGAEFTTDLKQCSQDEYDDCGFTIVPVNSIRSFGRLGCICRFVAVWQPSLECHTAIVYVVRVEQYHGVVDLRGQGFLQPFMACKVFADFLGVKGVLF